MGDFGESNVPSYKQGLGYGYFQFTKSEFISEDKKILLMKEVSIIVVVGLLT